jgi:hypothetical protein
MQRPGQLLGSVGVFAVLCTLVATSPLAAHGVAPRDARLLQSLDGPAVAPLLYLGAKHMVTGYDHLLFLAGVVFFLHRLSQVFVYVSLFTLGHSATLLAGAIGGLSVNPYFIDAVIGLSVAYKAFENMGGFSRIGWRFDSRVAVFVFGLAHGFGLATRLQDLALSPNGLVVNIVSFNVGVEIGQGLALTGVLLAIVAWRTRPSYARHAFLANVVLLTGGFVLTGYQLAGYLVTR